jgi:hypothetical protein
MGAARKYEVSICNRCGGHAGMVGPQQCTCNQNWAKHGTIVTATDDRDVDPLVEAAREAKDELASAAVLLDHAGEQRAAGEAHRTVVELGRALAPFEEGS